MEIFLIIFVVLYIVIWRQTYLESQDKKNQLHQYRQFNEYQEWQKNYCYKRVGNQTKLFQDFFKIYTSIFRLYQESERNKFNNTIKYDIYIFGHSSNISVFGPAIKLFRFDSKGKPVPASQYTEEEMKEFYEADRKFHNDRKRSIEEDKIKREKEEAYKLRQETERIKNEELKKQRIKASIAGRLIDKSIHIVKNSSCTYAGVYLIVNNITLDFYIGESQNIYFRRLTHLGQMAAPEKHHRPLIQKHYEQYGVIAFDFYVLQRVDNDTKEGTARKRIEEFYIKEYKPTYNNDF